MEKNKTSKPLKHPVGIYVFAWICIILGAISAWGTIMGVTSAIGVSIPVWRIIALLLLPLFWILLGIRLLKKYKAYQSENPEAAIKKSTKTILIICSVVAGIVVISSSIPLINQNRLNAKLQPYVKEELEENGWVPENPKYVLYDIDHERFSYPSSHHNDYAAKNPDEVNVIIAFSDGGTKIVGSWYDKGSGQNLADLQTQGASVYAIRLDDWSLIDVTSYRVQLKYGENGKNARGMVKEADILDLINTGTFPED